MNAAGFEMKREQLKLSMNVETPEERWSRAEQLDKQIRSRRTDTATGNWELGRDLDHMRREGLWQGIADSWREYVDSLGITQPMESMMRNNYRFYCVELGFELDDPRLLSAAETKLALGTRRTFQPWVRRDFERAFKEREPYIKRIAEIEEEIYQLEEGQSDFQLRRKIAIIYREMSENVTDFIDMCQTGEDSMTRADLRRWLEDKVGIEPKDSGSALGDTLEAIRDAKEASDALTDDEWLELAGELYDEEPVRNWLVRLVGAVKQADQSATVAIFGDDPEAGRFLGRFGPEIEAKLAEGQYGYRKLAKEYEITEALARRVLKTLREGGGGAD